MSENPEQSEGRSSPAATVELSPSPKVESQTNPPQGLPTAAESTTLPSGGPEASGHWVEQTERTATTAESSQGQRELVAAYERLQDEGHRRTQALATAAHELKTPLSILAGYIELLLTEKAGSLNDRQRQILTDAEFNCEFLAQYYLNFLTIHSVF